MSLKRNSKPEKYSFQEVDRIILSRDDLTKIESVRDEIRGNQVKMTDQEFVKEFKERVLDSLSIVEDSLNIKINKNEKLVYISENEVRKLIEYNKYQSWYLFFASILMGGVIGVLVNIMTSETIKFTKTSTFAIVIFLVFSIIFFGFNHFTSKNRKRIEDIFDSP